MAKDNRQIHLDPMEWRDAMRDVTGAKKATKKKATTKKAPAKKPAARKK
jgi:hypothetical protein